MWLIPGQVWNFLSEVEAVWACTMYSQIALPSYSERSHWQAGKILVWNVGLGLWLFFVCCIRALKQDGKDHGVELHKPRWKEILIYNEDVSYATFSLPWKCVYAHSGCHMFLLVMKKVTQRRISLALCTLLNQQCTLMSQMIMMTIRVATCQSRAHKGHCM